METDPLLQNTKKPTNFRQKEALDDPESIIALIPHGRSGVISCTA